MIFFSTLSGCVGVGMFFFQSPVALQLVFVGESHGNFDSTQNCVKNQSLKKSNKHTALIFTELNDGQSHFGSVVKCIFHEEKIPIPTLLQDDV